MRVDSNSGSILFQEDLTKVRVQAIAAGTNCSSESSCSSGNNNNAANGSNKSKIILESKSDKNKVEIVTYDNLKSEYLCELLRFFCAFNTMKTKEIQSTVLYLESGVIFLKYSKASLSPHEKLFFYRYDEEKKAHYLISKLPGDSNSRNEKVALFLDIKSISKKWEDGPGFRSF